MTCHTPTRHRSRADGGFTLSELLIAIAIVAVLAAVAVPAFLNQRDKGYDTQLRAGVRDIATLVQGSESDGTVERNGSGSQVFVAGEPVGDVRMSDGVRWNIAGTTGSFCVTAYHERSESYTVAHPLTYDSAAGGLGRTGESCATSTPIPFVSGPGLVGAGSLPTGQLQPDPWCPTTCPPTPPLGPGAPNILQNSAVDPSRPVTTHAYFSAQRAVVESPNPISSHAVRVTSVDSTKNQGVILWPRTDVRPVKMTAGEKWSSSIYIKGPAGKAAKMGVRWAKPAAAPGATTYHSEAWCPVTLTGDWQRLTCRTTITQARADEANLIGIQIIMMLEAGQTFDVTGWQLEKADIPSVFQPTR